MRTQLSVKAKTQQINEVDKSWMKPQLKIWVEQIGELKEDIFQRAILEGIDLNTANYISIKENKKGSVSVHLIHERSRDDYDRAYKGYDDMVNMEIINDAELLVNITTRYQNNLIFTYVGPTLLVINPFQSIKNMFDASTKFNYIGEIIYKKNTNYKDLPPHIFALGAEAYRALFQNEKNQSIVISGESGAGKTENAKYCMNLMTSIGSYNLETNDQNKNLNNGVSTKSSEILDMITQPFIDQQIGIEDKILSCNPILEAFGNAKTVRNNNSSRFGKYVSMKVGRDSRKIGGAEITNYLLEKSRIVSQGLNERNFHIFYHLIKGMSPDHLTKYHLSQNGQRTPFEEFRYLKSKTNSYSVVGINDEQLFAEVTASLNKLGFSDDIENIFRVVAIVLHLGNVVFQEHPDGQDHPCSVGPPELMINLSDLLSLSQEDISLCLTVRQRELQKQIVNSPLTKVDCEGMRDAWAKELYERLFNWLVEKLNKNIVPDKGVDYLSLGLLDIYGFEVFDTNGFEQLMINFTNEKLHQLYISYVFKEEEIVFTKEGLKEFCGQIKFTDNQLVIDLLEKFPVGVLDLLDESCVLKGDDDGLLQQIRKIHKDSSLLIQPKMPSKPTFIVVHTAKDVEYSIHGFRDKNKDEVPPLMLKLSQGSKNVLVASLFHPVDATLSPDKARKNKSLARKVRSQLIELMKELNSCDVHFARCIKPNDEKVPQKIVQDYTLNQIRYLGVLDSLKVRKQNYPIRRPYQFFYKIYGDMTKNKIYPHLLKEKVNFRDLVIAMFKNHYPELGQDQVLFGNDRIFIRLTAMSVIEKTFNECIVQKNNSARKLQKAWRVKKLMIGLHKFFLRIQKIKRQVKQFRQKIYYKKKIISCIKIQRWIKRCLSEQKKRLYKNQTQKIQISLKRAFAVNKQRRLQAAVLRIQRYVRVILKMKKLIINRNCKAMVLFAVSKAWLMILDKKPIKFQSTWRGYHFRLTHQEEIQQIKEFKRQMQLRKVVVKIQKNVRGYLVRKKMKKLNLAVTYIQGYFKMRWLSDLFQRMRTKIRIIQVHVRTLLARVRALQVKYEQYVLPWVKEFEAQKIREENHLFGVEQFDSPQRQLDKSQNSQSKLSPFSYTCKQNANTSPVKPKAQDNYYQKSTKITTFDDILQKESDPQVSNPKIQLFAFVVDLEIFTDTSEFSSPTWSQTYKQLFEQTYGSGNPIQTIHAGSQQCFVTTTNGKVFSWGQNEFNQCALPRKFQDINKLSTVTMPGRIVQVESGADNTLFLTQDGKLFAAGSNYQGQIIGEKLTYIMKEVEVAQPIKFMCSTYNTTLSLGEDGKLFTWPVRNDQGELINQPLQLNLPIGNLVHRVSCGNRFALLLTQHGTLFSFGENSEGELGLSNKEVYLEPTQLNTKNLKFDQISCGLKHSIARTTSGKVYVWGWGAFGQLGNGRSDSILEPHLIELAEIVTQVQASHKSSLVLMDSKTVLWCGSNNTIIYQNTFTKFMINEKCQQLHNQHFSIVRLMATFSRSYSVIYFTYANHKNMFKNNPAKERGVLHTLTHHWLESGIKTINPPSIDIISNFFCEKHMKKQFGMNQNANLSYRVSNSLKSQNGNTPPDGRLSAKNHQKLQPSEFKLSEIASNNHTSNLQIDTLNQSQNNQETLDLTNYQAQKNHQQNYEPQTLNNSQIQQENIQEPCQLNDSYPNLTIQLKFDQYLKEEGLIRPEQEKLSVPKKKQQNYYKYNKPSRSPLQYRVMSKSPIYLSTKNLNKKGKQDTNVKSDEKLTTSKEQLNSKIELNEKRDVIDHLAKSGFSQDDQSKNSLADVEDITESKIKKLRDIKERLIRLKTMPQSSWSASDHDFVQNIYNTNLSLLLDL